MSRCLVIQHGPLTALKHVEAMQSHSNWSEEMSCFLQFIHIVLFLIYVLMCIAGCVMEQHGFWRQLASAALRNEDNLCPLPDFCPPQQKHRHYQHLGHQPHHASHCGCVLVLLYCLLLQLLKAQSIGEKFNQSWCHVHVKIMYS